MWGKATNPASKSMDKGQRWRLADGEEVQGGKADRPDKDFSDPEKGWFVCLPVPGNPTPVDPGSRVPDIPRLRKLTTNSAPGRRRRSDKRDLTHQVELIFLGVDGTTGVAVSSVFVLRVSDENQNHDGHLGTY
jgi:hypothetical protein